MAAKMEHIIRFNRINTNVDVLAVAINGVNLHAPHTADTIYSLSSFADGISNDLLALAKEIDKLEAELENVPPVDLTKDLPHD